MLNLAISLLLLLLIYVFRVLAALIILNAAPARKKNLRGGSRRTKRDSEPKMIGESFSKHENGPGTSTRCIEIKDTNGRQHITKLFSSSFGKK
jgi:hypothetical protein